jgi:hypothetical protein
MYISQSADRKSKLFSARRNEDGNVLVTRWQKNLPAVFFTQIFIFFSVHRDVAMGQIDCLSAV